MCDIVLNTASPMFRVNNYEVVYKINQYLILKNKFKLNCLTRILMKYKYKLNFNEPKKKMIKWHKQVKEKQKNYPKFFESC